MMAWPFPLELSRQSAEIHFAAEVSLQQRHATQGRDVTQEEARQYMPHR